MNHIKFIFLYILLISSISSCKIQNTKLENDIIKIDTIKYKIDNVTIKLPTDSIKEVTDEFIKNFRVEKIDYLDSLLSNTFISLSQKFERHKKETKTMMFQPSEYKPDTVFTYLETLQKEAYDLRYWRKRYPDKVKNNKYAKYIYNGYINHGLTEMIIFTDVNNNVTVINIEQKLNGNHYHESYQYEGDEIQIIVRSSRILEKRELLQEHISWKEDREYLKFIQNTLVEKVHDGIDRDISKKEALSMLYTAIYFRNIANAIVKNNLMRCRDRKASFGNGTVEYITDYFNNKMNPEIVELISDEEFIYRELFKIKLDTNGNVDSAFINTSLWKLRIANDEIKDSVVHRNNARSKYGSNKEHREIINEEAIRILYGMKWNTEMKDCKTIPTEIYITVMYNYLFYGYNRGGRFDPNSKNKNKFSIYVGRL